MTRFADAATEIVRRHPAPAIAVHELRELMEMELPGSGLPFLDEAVVTRLARETPPLRVLPEPTRRWLPPLGPRAWILDDGAGGDRDAGGRTIAGQVRRTLVRMARAVDPESATAWARWNRLLEEEREVRRGFRSRERARKRREMERASRSDPTTIRPPGPRPGARGRPPRRTV